MSRPAMTGRCACGTVHFELLDRPIVVHCCHCTWCQRESGSAFAVNALMAANEVSLLQGQPTATPVPTASGEPQMFHRCPSCGVTLWSTYGGAGEDVLFVRSGTLDDPSFAEPDVHIFTSTARQWFRPPKDARTFAGFYDYEAELPPENFARLKAAHGVLRRQ